MKKIKQDNGEKENRLKSLKAVESIVITLTKLVDENWNTKKKREALNKAIKNVRWEQTTSKLR